MGETGGCREASPRCVPFLSNQLTSAISSADLVQGQKIVKLGLGTESFGAVLSN